jgi:cytochrome c-type biogenesis protein CcmH/NrfG
VTEAEGLPARSRSVPVWGVVLAVTALLSGAVSWFVARQMESPRQAAARAKPPTAVPVAAPLVMGVLESPVSVAALWTERW